MLRNTIGDIEKKMLYTEFQSAELVRFHVKVAELRSLNFLNYQKGNGEVT